MRQAAESDELRPLVLDFEQHGGRLRVKLIRQKIYSRQGVADADALRDCLGHFRSVDQLALAGIPVPADAVGVKDDLQYTAQQAVTKVQ